MAGTKEGGIKARQTNLQTHGDDFYKRIGALGGQKGTGHAFAHGKLDPRATGKLGGRPNSRPLQEA